jgi:hypothetical protein
MALNSELFARNNVKSTGRKEENNKGEVRDALFLGEKDPVIFRRYPGNARSS